MAVRRSFVTWLRWSLGLAAIGISPILRYCEGVVIHMLMARCSERRRRPVVVHMSNVQRGGRRAHSPGVPTQWRVTNDGYE